MREYTFHCLVSKKENYQKLISKLKNELKKVTALITVRPWFEDEVRQLAEAPLAKISKVWDQKSERNFLKIFLSSTFPQKSDNYVVDADLLYSDSLKSLLEQLDEIGPTTEIIFDSKFTIVAPISHDKFQFLIDFFSAKNKENLNLPKKKLKILTPEKWSNAIINIQENSQIIQTKLKTTSSNEADFWWLWVLLGMGIAILVLIILGVMLKTAAQSDYSSKSIDDNK
jgi:lipopolysaccharide biosynthesis glycosyltransferase